MIKFAERYLITGNGTQSAKDAGYAHSSASVHAADLLRDPRIVEYIEKRRAAAAAKVELTIGQLAHATAMAAYVDPAGFFNEDGSVKAVLDLTVEQRAAIQSLEITEEVDGGKVKRKYRYRLMDRNRAQERLGKHLGFFQMEARQRVDALAQLLAFIEVRGSRLPVSLNNS